MRLVLLVGCSTLVACSSDSVRAMFIERESCPSDRVIVAREAQPTWEVPVNSDPPPEIAADPTRLAIYHQSHPVEDFSHRRFFRAEGCGHRDHFMCDVPTPATANDGTPTMEMTCIAISPPVVTPNTDPLGLEYIMTSATDTDFGKLAVDNVRADSAAAHAGFLKNDIILEIDHQKIEPGMGMVIQAKKILSQPAPPGGHVFHIQRGANVLDLSL